FILLALAINTEQSIDSFIFYIIQYSITNLNIFLIIIALGFILNKEGIKMYSKNVLFYDFDIRFLYNFKGQFFANPILSLSLIICLFSMAGKKNADLAFNYYKVYNLIITIKNVNIYWNLLNN